VGLYPRTISVFRTAQTAQASNNPTVGEVGYQGRVDAISRTVDLDDETPLFRDLPADIMLKRAGRSRGQQLPSDGSMATLWTISMPAWALPIHSIRDEDIIRDDEGYRYIVGSNYFTILGYQIECTRLEM
jgi:hypothetical protein